MRACTDVGNPTADHEAMADPLLFAHSALAAGEQGAASHERTLANVKRVVDPWKQATHKVTTHIYGGLTDEKGKRAYPGIAQPGRGVPVRGTGRLPGSSIPGKNVMSNRPAAHGLFLAHHLSGGSLITGALSHARTRASANAATAPISGTQFGAPPPSPPIDTIPEPGLNPWGGDPGRQPL